MSNKTLKNVNSLHELVDIAATELELVIELNNVDIDMDVWLQQACNAEKCGICVAGSVIYNKLIENAPFKSGKFINMIPEDFDDKTCVLLYTIENLRSTTHTNVQFEEEMRLAYNHFDTDFDTNKLRKFIELSIERLDWVLLRRGDVDTWKCLRNILQKCNM